MKVEEWDVGRLKPYANNPRLNDNAVSAVAASIREFGFKVPIIVDKDGVIVAGHTRLKAAVSLDMDKVPVIVADDLTPEQVRAFRLADNKVAELAEWDEDALRMELESLSMEMERFGFEVVTEQGEEGENPYTKKVEIPKYEPMEDEPPGFDEMLDTEKTKRLIAEIEASKVPKDVKEFLKAAAWRHAVFHYGRIAEYYCHADKEVQELMEKSALVIIDYGKAIEYGYTTLKSELDKLLEEDRK